MIMDQLSNMQMGSYPGKCASSGYVAVGSKADEVGHSRRKDRMNEVKINPCNAVTSVKDEGKQHFSTTVLLRMVLLQRASYADKCWMLNLLGMYTVMNVGGPDAGGEEQKLKGQEMHGHKEQHPAVWKRLQRQTEVLHLKSQSARLQRCAKGQPLIRYPKFEQATVKLLYTRASRMSTGYLCICTQ